MYSFEINKIAAAVLLGALTLMVSMQVGKMVIHEPASLEAAVQTDLVPTNAGDNTDTGATVIDPVSALLATADIAAGEAISKRCTSCHSFTKAGPHKIGPNLWNIVGNKTGHIEGFSYSQGMLALNKNWGYEELNQFLYSPKGYVTGTKMTFAGLKKLQERANLIAWLRLQSDAPLALPTAP